MSWFWNKRGNENEISDNLWDYGLFSAIYKRGTWQRKDLSLWSEWQCKCCWQCERRWQGCLYRASAPWCIAQHQDSWTTRTGSQLQQWNVDLLLLQYLACLCVSKIWWLLPLNILQSIHFFFSIGDLTEDFQIFGTVLPLNCLPIEDFLKSSQLFASF